MEILKDPKRRDKLVSILVWIVLLTGLAKLGLSFALRPEPPTGNIIIVDEAGVLGGGSCFRAEQCSLIRYICAPGYESFSDSASSTCACGCRPVKDAASQPPGDKKNDAPPAVGIPACNSAPFDEHYELAVQRLAARHPSFRVARESAEEVGPCNNLNTASSQFNVVDERGVSIGTITVNGDTKTVTLKTSQGSESL